MPGSLRRLILAAIVLFAAAPLVSGQGAPCYVGAQLGLQPGGTPEPKYMRELAAFVEGDMADYVNLGWDGLTDAERENAARYLTAHHVRFLVQESWATPKHHFTADQYRRLRAIAGDLFLGVHTGELDSSGMPPETYLPDAYIKRPTRREVHDAFVARVRRVADAFRSECGVPVAHSSAGLTHSLFAEAGVDMLCTETGENAPNVSMLIASNRGAARAYDLPWMIDHSTWWQPRGHAGSLVSPREGHTPWCMFNSLLEAVMGGATCAQLEVDWAAYDMQKLVNGHGPLEPPLPWGVALRNLRSLAHTIGPRGETATPIAILVSSESGWPGVGWRVGDVRGAGLFDGLRHKFMQTREADLSLKALDIFFPGFERCGWDPEYPGFLSESPLGAVDIVPDNLPAARYARYKLMVALGYHRSTPTMRSSLRTYVERGGVLVCGDTLFIDEHERPVAPHLAEPLTGCSIDFRPATLVRLYQPSSSLEAIPGVTAEGPVAPSADQPVKLVGRDEWQAHWLHPIRPTTGRVISRMNAAPYIVENRIGSGRVFFVTALNLVGSDSRRRGQEPFLYANMLYYFLHTLKDNLGDGVSFAPWTGLNYIYDTKPDGSALLLVMNEGDMPYRRDARLRNLRSYRTARVAAQGSWNGWRPGAEVPMRQDGDDLTWSFTMAPKSFVLFEFHP